MPGSKDEGVEAEIHTGKERFGIRASRIGVTCLQAPPSPCGLAWRRKAGVDINIIKNSDDGALRWIEMSAAFLESVLEGTQPVVSPSVDLGVVGEFTRCVLEITRGIPWGETRTYKWLAQTACRPRATRAAGRALGRNPVPLIVPCHRIVMEDGRACGYSLGIEWKKWLLEMERGGGS